MKPNINTQEYWDHRFSSGDWEDRRGRWQTESFARAQIPHLGIARDFAGTIVDFGCGLGDAIPVYREFFPKAILTGVDISGEAIKQCRQKYGRTASFAQGDYLAVPEADIIIASNVFEHLPNDRLIARHLISRCSSLYIIVPYRERPLDPEHINRYGRDYFHEIGGYDWRVFTCPGWSQYGRRLIIDVYLKNIGRLFLGRPIRRRGKQILFRFRQAEWKK